MPFMITIIFYTWLTKVCDSSKYIYSDIFGGRRASLAIGGQSEGGIGTTYHTMVCMDVGSGQRLPLISLSREGCHS